MLAEKLQMAVVVEVVQAARHHAEEHDSKPTAVRVEWPLENHLKNSKPTALRVEGPLDRAESPRVWNSKPMDPCDLRRRRALSSPMVAVVEAQRMALAQRCGAMAETRCAALSHPNPQSSIHGKQAAGTLEAGPRCT